MTAGKAVCLVCGEPLEYWEEAQEVTCHICGKKETGHSICVAGHYVCDACHRSGGVDHVMECCLKSASKNPIQLAMELMDDRSIYPNGPEHHTLVGAVLLTAYANAGGASTSSARWPSCANARCWCPAARADSGARAARLRARASSGRWCREPRP